jgi:SAM-dependent methyltransferase
MPKSNPLEWYWKLERLLVPGLKFSKLIYEEELFQKIEPNISWLDLGCGRRLLPPWRQSAERELLARPRILVGVDPDLPSLRDNETIQRRVAGSISSLPFAAGSFDVVTANMVIEHLEDPQPQFAEVARILKPSGKFIFHTPNVWGYTCVLSRLVPDALLKALALVLERRAGDDVFPAFYRANSGKTIERLASNAGLRVVETRFIADNAAAKLIVPLAFFELLWIRALMSRPFRRLRTNLIVTLEKV